DTVKVSVASPVSARISFLRRWERASETHGKGPECLWQFFLRSAASSGSSWSSFLSFWFWGSFSIGDKGSSTAAMSKHVEYEGVCSRSPPPSITAAARLESSYAPPSPGCSGGRARKVWQFLSGS